MEFRSLNPFRRFFSLRVNDRDHRKILVVDGHVAFLGGVNLDLQYLNPRSAGIPPDRDTKKAFWEDAAARFLGHAAADARRLFFHTWHRYGGDPIAVPALPVRHGGGGELVCVEGSAPREGEPLHIRALAAALGAARTRVWVASGLFRADAGASCARCARRRPAAWMCAWWLPGVSDVMGAVHAARADVWEADPGRRADPRAPRGRAAREGLHGGRGVDVDRVVEPGSTECGAEQRGGCGVLGRETAAATEAMMPGLVRGGHGDHAARVEPALGARASGRTDGARVEAADVGEGWGSCEARLRLVRSAPSARA